jgi:hypothetical protein
MPDKFNPFRPDKMMPPGMFSGRLDELKFIDHCLLQTKHGNPQHFLIEGERGIGKSSLLLCEQFVAQGHIETLSTKQKLDFLVVSTSLLETDDYFSIIRKVAAAFKAEIAKRSAFKSFALSAWDVISRIEAAGFSYDRTGGQHHDSELLGCLQNDFVHAASNLDGVADGILLLIDEADKPPVGGNLGLICKMLTEELSRRNCERVCIGLAGLPQVLDVLKASHESSLRIFKTMELMPLEDVERENVLDQGIEDANKKNTAPATMTTAAKKMIANLSEGYPHFLQEFAYCAFEEDTNNIIDESDVLQSLFREHGSFDQLGRKYFAQYYQMPGSDDYRKVLDVMSDHGNDWVSRGQIIKESGLKGGTVDNALRFLKSNAIINPDLSKSGLYKLPTRSFAVWVKAKKRAEKAKAG